ncbi:hypothetical protein Tco_0010124 [Tanacetum coccineum]
MKLKTSSSFKTTGLLQPWQTLCKIFSKCLTTCVTRWDQPPLQIMQMMYCFVNNIHVDYAELLWEGLYYSLHHPTSSILYPRFTKIIVSHYMTVFPEISRRARDKDHNLKDDDIMKNIFNSGRHKDRVGMQISAWMIFRGNEAHRALSDVCEAESSAPRRSTVIRLRIPERRSARLTPPAPVPTADKADEMILQDTLQVSLAEHKSREKQEARENMALNVVDDSSILRNDESNIPGTRIEPRSDKESLEVEITNDKEVEITNVVIPVNVNDEDEEITDEVYELKQREKGKIVEESRNSPIPTPIRSLRIHTDLVSSDTKKLQELTITGTKTAPSSSSQNNKLSTTNRLLSLFKTKPARFKCYKSFFQELQGRYGYLFANLRARFMSRKSFDTLADHLQEVMVESLPTMVDSHIKKQVQKQVPEQVRDEVPVYVAKGLILERQKTKEQTERMIARALLQERGNIQAQISSQIDNAIANIIPSQVDASVRSYMSGHILHVHPVQSQTTSVPDQQYQLYLAMKADPQLQQQDIAIWLALQMKESSSGQVYQEEQAPSTSCNQEQEDDFDFWTDAYASDDDEIPTKQVSQNIMEELSLTIDEAKLRKIPDEMLRQRCTSGDEHQYHIDQMKNFLKSDIVWESRKEILVSLYPQKTTPLVHSCQRDPEAPALSLINQDLLYLKKGNSGPEKIVLSLHKFPAVIFNDEDIEERTSRWVNKCVRKFNPYARYSIEHWKNPHAKIFYIRKQKEPGKPKKEIYSNSKIIQVVKTYWELGHEHKFITEIVARRANKCIVSITEPDYKNLNKNDIEDIYLLIMNDLTKDEAEYLKLFEEEIEVRLKYRKRMRRWEIPIKTEVRREDEELYKFKEGRISGIKTAYTAYSDPQGVIYEDQNSRNRLMCTDELHKFSNGTPNSVRTTLHDITSRIRMGYMPKKKWSRLDKRRARVMIKDIDKEQHQSDTYVFTMKMEILPVSTSNNTAVDDLFNTSAGNSVKVILLKLNLPNHRYIKMDMERRSVKLKELQERCIIKAFKLKNQEKYEHVRPKVTSTQDGKRSQVDDKIL